VLSQRVRSIAPSPTLQISDQAAEMRAAGIDVLDFSAGQPDFPTPEEVKRAGIEAIRQDKTRYTANVGALELREAIARTLSEERGLDYPVDSILVSPGAKASLYFACMALLDEGDEALVPSPYWVSYPEQVSLAGGRSVLVPCDEASGFKLDVDRLREACTDKSRILILNYPSNPTGACYSREELEPIARFCVERNLWILADEIYSRLLFDDRSFTSIAALSDEVRRRTVVIDGMSKAWAMTGWRIGFAAAPVELIRGMARLQSHATSNATSISQFASIAGLNGRRDELEQRAKEFQRRRDCMVARLRAIPGVSCVMPEGSFYVFPNVSGCFTAERGWKGAKELAAHLLEQARVAVVPGEAFGSPAHMRLSYATSMERIEEGMSRIEEALA